MKKLLQLMLVVGALTGAAFIGGCADRDRADYQARVNNDLKAANLDAVCADWQEDEKTLHLRGEVEQAADKTRAEQVAKQVVGTSARVVNEVTVEGTDADAMDDRLEEDLTRPSKKTTSLTTTSWT